MSTLDYSPAAWHIKPDGSNIDAEHRVTREKFSGTPAQFNAIVIARQSLGVDVIDTLVNSGKQPVLVSNTGDGGIVFDDGVASRATRFSIRHSTRSRSTTDQLGKRLPRRDHFEKSNPRCA